MKLKFIRRKVGLGGERPPDTEAEGSVAVGRKALIPSRRTVVPGSVVPGTAAQDTLLTLTRLGGLRRAIPRRIFVIVLVTVCDPLPDVAVHIVKAKVVWCLPPDRMRLSLGVFFVPCKIAKFCLLIAKRESRCLSAARRILPFCFREQSVLLAGPL